MQPKLLVNTLTDIEKEILYLLAHGYSNRQIAGRLFYSVDNIKFLIKDILKKFSVKNRAHAVAIAFSGGMFDEKSLIEDFEKKI